MERRKLEKMPYAQAYVVIENGQNFTLISYRTRVCIVKNNVLTVTGLYSQTTRKHIGAFMKEYIWSNYQLAKKLYEDKKAMDIVTGEIFDKAVND